MMPGCSLFASDKRKVDYFQRRKVGSIRDNPKLMKIRQQFENASKDRLERRELKDNNSVSLNLPKNSNISILTELLKLDSKCYSKPDSHSFDSKHNRRHSEGEITSNNSISVFCNQECEAKLVFPSHSVDELSDDFVLNSSNSTKIQRDNSVRKYEFQISMLRSSNSFDSAKQTGKCTKNSPSKNEISSNILDEAFIPEPAPPIPKRGISPAVQNSFLQPQKDTVESKDLFFKLLTLKEDPKNPNSVQKAIELYEGMASPSVIKKNKIFKNYSNNVRALKREDSGASRRSHSRRNSLRKSKILSDKTDIAKFHMKEKENSAPIVDSGVLSDGEDRNQGIYQTLSTSVVNMTQTFCDTYDRLDRVHDITNHIHKGQTSACAACKAIPSSVFQLQDTDSPFVEVKCNEESPHHHPPCICFACQHSVFSCCVNGDELGLNDNNNNESDDLDYNICCLNPPNRESWRQSRRRPICEQNGRVCNVNCYMEKHSSAKTVVPEKCYENISECCSQSSQSFQQKESSKQVSVDSCESDEGWVDVTDSEDEKSLLISKEKDTSNYNTYNHNTCEISDEQNSDSLSIDINDIVVKYSNLDLSKSLSTEHLYESITDPEEVDESENQETSNSSLKSEQTLENDLDSGEWSTESGSPVFNEPSFINKQKTSQNPNRFTVGYESQESSKKNFMKSVLGKKPANTTKKRRMSNFFVPWLVSNTEYVSADYKSHKSCSKKQSVCPQNSSAKMKRSQSVTPESSKINLSCTNCSAEMIDKCKSSPASASSSCSLLDNLSLSPEVIPSFSSRSSTASSTYIRADQLQSTEIPKRKMGPSADAAVDVSVERVLRRSSSGNSEHSYILFTPIKEDQVPLYQFYERNVKERVSFCRSSKSMSPIMWSSSIQDNHEPCSPQMSVVEQLSPDATDMKMLWCELPEVKESGILERISAQELKLQEALFEFIQSQASYIRSLKVLYENFICTPDFSDIESSTSILSKHEQDVLFSDIIQVKEVSERILGEVTTRWNDGILIPDICDIIHHHAQLPSFSVYIKYCSNRVYQERTLKELKESRLCFLEALRKLESNPICQGLSLESFLFLPMQHIARLPLLLDSIFSWISPESPSYSVCKSALECVHKIFVKCNEGARKMERLEEMFVLNKQLEFKECKVIPLISASRWLLKKGELMRLEFDKKTFGRSNRCVKIPIFIFLFNDLLVLSKRKNDDCYTVLDYCLRENVQATAINAQDLQQPLISHNICRYLIYLKLSNNHQGANVDMIFNCTLLSERTRWIEAIHSETQNKPCEIREYDCPQVQCFKNYIAQQPDELSLQESDVVTIHRKMNDGWYEGRRLRDGLRGWFPASYTVDIPCSRARASNLRQCYRLLMLSNHSKS